MTTSCTETDADLLAAIVEETPTPLWVIAPGGAVRLVNQAAVALLGYPGPGELLGRPSHCTLHDRHPDGSEYPAESCPIVGRAGPHPRAGTEWFTTRTGRPLPVLWSTRALPGSDCTLLAFEDASDRVAAEHQRDTWTRREVARRADAFGGRTRSAFRDELLRQVHEHFRDPGFTVAVLARNNHVSVRSVQALFAESGRAPGDEIRRTRLEFARRLLERGAAVGSACYDSGFSDPGTFTRAFRRHFGRSPTSFLRELA
ncbi:helix-turn-helix domain-containing protein [Nocardia jiangsuensis]|uniref:Helix-turn-helix domain-containing protein n=1 Tax=Nocardia jiangsuensis TaxID=1691563 RepID=A0ABV8DVK4_9NOCA